MTGTCAICGTKKYQLIKQS